MTLVSIIIPVYNEASKIGDVVNAVNRVQLLFSVEKEIIIVDDGSRDDTPRVLETLKGKVSEILFCEKNSGKGAALRLGFSHAHGDILLIQDSDLEYFPEEYPELIEPILSGKTDIVYGSRFKGKIEGMCFCNLLANKILVWIVRLLYGAWLTDEATAYKVFRRSVLDKINLKANGFEFCPEFTAKVIKAGFKIEEVPICYKARTIKEGKKIRWTDGLIAAWTLVKYRFCS